MKEKVNGTDKVQQNLPPYGLAFGRTPQELQSGIHRMAMSGYKVDGGIVIHTMKVRRFRRIPFLSSNVGYMCVLMVLE